MDQSIGEHDKRSCPEDGRGDQGQLVARSRDEDEWHQLESRQNPSTSDLPASRSHLLHPLSSFISSSSSAASFYFSSDCRRLPHRQGNFHPRPDFFVDLVHRRIKIERLSNVSPLISIFFFFEMTTSDGGRRERRDNGNCD